ncbi:FAD-dependent oxidoreductase [Prosthecodimorpha staleyi]|uniref:FAD-dependent oxidoreductase n=1 Tax=Prosthecodimorpha staleyi TaxID=2840188 RepID=A0A947GFT2_9HYPH|nr:FAD-dependent oxidoreductase [Prosthecodimorpha staleyi]MBT9293226.1 FAD-dependent oxidoreductase [Prosthecodimorpha staleyi]
MSEPGARRPGIVLVGGGHAHVQVMTRMAAAHRSGIPVTLIARDLDTPYSGMLPGLVAGLYRRDEIHIDLVRLAAATGTRLIHAAADGIDRAARRVHLQGHPPVAYDLLSIDVGITPDLSEMAGADRHAVAVKPIGGFLDRLETLRAEAARAGGRRRIVVVGGGAAGIELILALYSRLRADAAAAGRDPDGFAFALVTGARLVPTLSAGIRRRVARALATRGIAVHGDARVVAIEPDRVVTAAGASIAADAVLVSTKARAPAWLAATGLALAPDGSIAVGPTLQSLTDPAILAAGDCAAMVASPREKAGVFAVRQGPILAENLIALAHGTPLRAYRPQHRFLVLIATGDGRAVGGRGPWPAFEGRWVWAWKDRIDRRFLRTFMP